MFSNIFKHPIPFITKLSVIAKNIVGQLRLGKTDANLLKSTFRFSFSELTIQFTIKACLFSLKFEVKE